MIYVQVQLAPKPSYELKKGAQIRKMARRIFLISFLIMYPKEIIISQI